jgi:hypothetical protein
MRTLGWLGAVLLIIGSGIMIFGIAGGVRELGGMYEQVLEHPLDEPEVDEKTERPGRILFFVAIGAVGAVPAVAGGVMLKIAVIRALLRGKKTAPGPATGPAATARPAPPAAPPAGPPRRGP